MKRHPLFYRLPAIPAILSATSRRKREVEYNEWGAMTKDEARGITSITYDRLGNPSRVDFSSPNGSYASYVYSATGERLKATHYTKLQSLGEIEAANYLTDDADNADNIDPPTPEIPDPIGPGNLQIAGMTKLEYHGPVIYRDGYVDMVRFPGGYATIIDGTVTFHYYTQDYLGNNRAVVNGSTGEIEQTVAYYPYGAVIADLGISSSYQPFKFGGKELTTQNGLNEYDFGARQYYPAVPGFTSIDRKCEKYYWLSPYLYCGNNPVNFSDPTGMDIWQLDSEGHVLSCQSFEGFEMIMVLDNENKITGSWKGDYGTISDQFSKGKPSESATFTGFEINGDIAGTEIFELLAENTSVEWSQLKTGDNADESANYVSTTHLKGEDASAFIMITEYLSEKPVREYIHNHPSNTPYPSGMKPRDTSGDVFSARWLDRINPVSATYKIFTPKDRSYIRYNADSKLYEFMKSLPEIYVDP